MHRFKLAFAIITAATVLAPAAASARDIVRLESPRRELWQIQRSLGERLDQLEQLQNQIFDLASRRPSAARSRYMKDLTRQSMLITRELRALQNDLREALRGDGPVYGHPQWEDDYEYPRPVPVEGGWAPLAMEQGEFQFLLKSIDDATFPSYQINALKDSIVGGSFFDVFQAETVLARFPHETHKVEAAVLMCPRIVERGALPRLIAGFTFETYKQELRDRTNNVCGFYR